MIEVSNLSYQYPSGKLLHFPDFKLGQGAHCLLLGDSGSGKTTLLHLIGGLLRTQKGNIIIRGTDLAQLSETGLDHFRGKNVGFVFQKNHLIASLTVKKNLLLSSYLAEVKQDPSRVESVLEHLGLHENLNSAVSQLSQGQAQRVAIARAVLNNPAVIFADEPTSALDDTNCERVINLLLVVAAENNSTLVVATHDQRLKQKIKNQILLTANQSVK
jgi:putative ABC transport system ATP-binding protein